MGGRDKEKDGKEKSMADSKDRLQDFRAAALALPRSVAEKLLSAKENGGSRQLVGRWRRHHHHQNRHQNFHFQLNYCSLRRSQGNQANQRHQSSRIILNTLQRLLILLHTWTTKHVQHHHPHPKGHHLPLV